MKHHLPPRLGLGFGAALALALTSAQGAVSLPALISDHAVLQKSAKTVLWGKAAPGEHVTATVAGVRGEATATAPDGKWRIEVDLSHVGQGPFDLVIEGTNKITVSDVAVGEVWLASGQSNMEFTLSRSIGAEEEIAASANSQLRQFRVANNAAPTVQDECKGKWVLADPKTAGGFTAIGYYFGKTLQQSLHTPVGLIHSSWGGTPVETWTSAEALESNPELKAGKDRINKDVDTYNAGKPAYVTSFHEWAKQYDRADKPADPAAFAAPEISTTDWQPVVMPGKFSAAGLPDSGAIWIRKTVPIHGAARTVTSQLELQTPEGFETVYYNGKLVSSVTPDNYAGIGARHYYYLKDHVEGDNVIAIRIYNPVGGAGLSGNPDRLALDKINLKGEWLAKAEYALPPLSAEAQQTAPQPPKSVVLPHNRPCTLYNGMIAPLQPYTIQGTIWYQGENNAGRACQYQAAFPLMITDWRQRWDRNFPFYFCQLASFQDKKPQPSESAWGELREAQTKTLSLPNTGEAILIDLGETGDVHPRNKKDAGQRLAAIALAKTYGKPVPYCGPVCDSQKIENGKIRLHFRELNGGLVARPLGTEYVASSLKKENPPLVRNSPNSQLEGFAICGEDKKWQWADAKIEGDNVVVSSPAVAKPVAVRYAWADSPTANLYNQAGLPAGPFRTDSFPGVTEQSKF
ncbi:MAG: sialate O-acetylesterase [Chthoniobacteraceae bacterium]